MRHVPIFKNDQFYENLKFKQFKALLLKEIDPPIIDSFEINYIPNNIEVIYHSLSLRARQTAELVQKKLFYNPVIDTGLQKLIAEITFSESSCVVSG